MTTRRTTIVRRAGTGAPTSSGHRTPTAFVVPGQLCRFTHPGCTDPLHPLQVIPTRIQAGTGAFYGRQHWDALRLLAFGGGEEMFDETYVCGDCRLCQRRRDLDEQTRLDSDGWYPERVAIIHWYVCPDCMVSHPRADLDGLTESELTSWCPARPSPLIRFVCAECQQYQSLHDRERKSRLKPSEPAPAKSSEPVRVKSLAPLPYVCEECNKTTRNFAQDELGRILCAHCYSKRDPNPVLEPAGSRLCACGCGKWKARYGSKSI